jgi:glutathione S-transferase
VAPPAEPVVFYQMRPCWGLPNASPFCMKVETWLRMAQIPYQARSVGGPPKSATGKVPYLVRPDGSLLPDSGAIIATLEREHQVPLDRDLSSSDRAVAVMLRRTFEDSLYFALLHQRWLVDENWQVTRQAYFGSLPAVVRATLVPLIRRKVRRDAWGQGVARMGSEQICQRGIEDISAVSELLGDRRFFLGDQPRGVDALAYAFLANFLVPPLQSPIVEAARARDNLVRYCDRMRALYWPEGEAATAGGGQSARIGL